jgi:hypothetical protein
VVTDPDLEALLAAIRPEPDSAFVARLERDLLGSDAAPASRRRRWRRLALVATSATAAVAGVVVAITLVGLSPFSGDPSLTAQPSCTTTIVHTQVLEPVIVTEADGTQRIERRRRPGTRPITVCGAPGDRTTTTP